MAAKKARVVLVVRHDGYQDEFHVHTRKDAEEIARDFVADGKRRGVPVHYMIGTPMPKKRK